MTWKLWLEDQLDDPNCPIRWTPEGFIGVKSSEEAIKLVEELGVPEFMDLDHDLGENDNTMIFLKWLSVNYDEVPKYKVHSKNTVGANNIISFLESWKKSYE